MKNFNSKATRRFAIMMGLLVVGSLGVATLALAATAPSCDATSGASCKVVGVVTTHSQASLYWTESRHEDERNFCYGIGNPTLCGPVSSRAFGLKVQLVTGLKPNTKYAYKFFGVYQNVEQSVVTGTFITDSTACGSTVQTAVEVSGVVLDASGDSLQNAVVTIVKPAVENIQIQTDTTDRSGGFHFLADPGSYQFYVEYPPFTSSTQITLNVIINKPLRVPDVVLKDAFQVGGTVVTTGKGDSIQGALVTAFNKANNAKIGDRITDYKGHFNFGMKAGEYLFNVSYGGKSLASPLDYKVTKSAELPKLDLGVTLGLRGKVGMHPASVGAREKFNVKGAVIPGLSDKAHAHPPGTPGFQRPE